MAQSKRIHKRANQWLAQVITGLAVVMAAAYVIIRVVNWIRFL